MNALILSEPLKALEPFQFFVFSFENDLCGSFFRGFRIETNHKRFFSGIDSDGCLKRVWKLFAGINEYFSRSPDFLIFVVYPIKDAIRLNLGKSGGKPSRGYSQFNKAINTAVPNERLTCVSVYRRAPTELVLFRPFDDAIHHFYKYCSKEAFHSLLLSMIKFCLAPLFSHRLEKAPSYLAQVKTMTTKENLLALANAVGGLMFLAVLVTVCLAMAAAPVALFIWLVYLMLKFLGVFA